MATALFISTLASQRPLAGVRGRFHLATDTNAVSVDNGISWDAVSTALGGGSGANLYEGTLANRPVSVGEADIYYATDIGTVYIDTAAAGWREIGRVPVVYGVNKYTVPVPPEHEAVLFRSTDVDNVGGLYTSVNEGINFPGSGNHINDNLYGSIYTPNYDQFLTATSNGQFEVRDSTTSASVYIGQNTLSTIRDMYHWATDGHRTVTVAPDRILYWDGYLTDAGNVAAQIKEASVYPNFQTKYQVEYFDGIWVIVGQATFLTSTDGDIWTEQTLPNGNTYIGCAMRTSDQTLWVTDQVSIYKTTDFGTNWTAGVDLRALYYTYSGHSTGWLVRGLWYFDGRLFADIRVTPDTTLNFDNAGRQAGAHVIAYSDDDGVTWNFGVDVDETTNQENGLRTKAWTGHSGNRASLVKTAEGNLFCAVNGQTVYKSTDNGATWDLRLDVATSSGTEASNDWQSLHLKGPNSSQIIHYDAAATHTAVSIYDMRPASVLPAQISDVQGTNHITTAFDPTLFNGRTTKYRGIYGFLADGTQGLIKSPYVIDPTFTFTMIVAAPNNATEKVLIYWNATNYVAILNDTVKWVVDGTTLNAVASGLPTDPFLLTISHNGTTAKAWANGGLALDSATAMAATGLAPEYLQSSAVGVEFMLLAHMAKFFTNTEATDQWGLINRAFPAF